MKKILSAIGNFIIDRFQNERLFLRFIGVLIMVVALLGLFLTCRLMDWRSFNQKMHAIKVGASQWQN